MGKKLLRYVIASILFLTIPIIFIHFVSSQSIPKQYSEEWPAVKQTAKLVTIGYFKKEKNLDIVIEKVEPPEEYKTHEVYLSGHVAHDKEQKISAVVNFSENYSIRDTSEDLF